MRSLVEFLALPGAGVRVHKDACGYVKICYLGGQGDLVSGLIMGITRVTIWIIGVINLLTKSP